MTSVARNFMTQRNAMLEICALLCQMVGSTFRNNLSAQSSRVRQISGIAWPLKMGPIGFPKTSERNYYSTLRKNRNKHTSHAEVEAWNHANQFFLRNHQLLSCSRYFQDFWDLFYLYPPIYVCVFQIVSFLQVFKLKTCMLFPSDHWLTSLAFLHPYPRAKNCLLKPQFIRESPSLK
jgi:hypothetical protein